MITVEPMSTTLPPPPPPTAGTRITPANVLVMTEPTTSPLAGADIIAIDHVGLAVPDLDAAISFHTGVLGGVVSHRERNTDQGVEEAMISYGTGAQVQLLAPLTPESTIAKFIGRSGPGLQQLAYRVTDVEAVSERLRAAGLRLLYPAPRRGTADSRINFVHPKDTGGVLVELVEPAGTAHPSV